MNVLRQISSEVKWVAFVLTRKIKSRLLFAKRLIRKPRLPNNPDGKILIHVGCGQIRFLPTIAVQN